MDKPHRKVVSPVSAMKLLGCKRNKFYATYVLQLTRLPKRGRNTYFDYEEVMDLVAKKHDMPEESYQIVKI